MDSKVLPFGVNKRAEEEHISLSRLKSRDHSLLRIVP